jgi:antitoxin FitA
LEWKQKTVVEGLFLAYSSAETIMSNITIELPDERMRQLQKLAHDANISPEDLLRTHVEEWLNAPSPEFLKVAQYVLKKNEELYRRLA